MVSGEISRFGLMLVEGGKDLPRGKRAARGEEGIFARVTRV